MALIRIVIDRAPRETAATTPRRDRLRRIGALGAALLLGAGLTLGITAASGSDTQPPSKSYTMLATPFKLFTNHSFAANATASFLVAGGATTIPTNATGVLLRVLGTSAKGGSIAVFPLGGTADGASTHVNWAPGAPANEQVEVGIGLKDDVSFKNGAIPATATATIIGYTTQVSAGDVTGTGGAPGQVLTNEGLGSGWADPGGPAYSTATQNFTIVFGHWTNVETLYLPPGTYAILFNSVYYGGNVNADNFDNADCQMTAGGSTLGVQNILVPTDFSQPVVLQGFFTSPGTSVTVACIDRAPQAGGGSFLDKYAELSAIQVSSASGNNTF